MLLSLDARTAKARETCPPPHAEAPPEQQAGSAFPGVPEDLKTRIFRLLKFGLLATTAGVIEALGLLQALFEKSTAYTQRLLPILETISSTVRRQIESALGDDPDLLILWQAVDLEMTSMLGIVRHGLVTDPRGFDAINEYDFRDWLKLNGASDSTINSPLVRASYDLAMAYEGGDYRCAGHAAGVALRGSLRFLFTYRGSIVWKMRAGMGDIVFAPFYEVLKRRGVSFQFFHRLLSVKLAPPEELHAGERPYVKALEFAVQAEVKNGEYQPLIDLDGLPCWPSMPDFSQLADGDNLKDRKFESHWDQRAVGQKTLRVTGDFDFVVLGIGLGADPLRLPGHFAARPSMARDGHAFEDRRDAGLSTLDARGHGSARMGWAAGLDVWVCRARSIPGATCGISSMKKDGPSGRARSHISAVR